MLGLTLFSLPYITVIAVPPYPSNIRFWQEASIGIDAAERVIGQFPSTTQGMSLFGGLEYFCCLGVGGLVGNEARVDNTGNGSGFYH